MFVRFRQQSDPRLVEKSEYDSYYSDAIETDCSRNEEENHLARCKCLYLRVALLEGVFLGVSPIWRPGTY